MLTTSHSSNNGRQNCTYGVFFTLDKYSLEDDLFVIQIRTHPSGWLADGLPVYHWTSTCTSSLLSVRSYIIVVQRPTDRPAAAAASACLALYNLFCLCIRENLIPRREHKGSHLTLHCITDQTNIRYDARTIILLSVSAGATLLPLLLLLPGCNVTSDHT